MRLSAFSVVDSYPENADARYSEVLTLASAAEERGRVYRIAAPQQA